MYVCVCVSYHFVYKCVSVYVRVWGDTKESFITYFPTKAFRTGIRAKRLIIFNILNTINLLAAVKWSVKVPTFMSPYAASERMLIGTGFLNDCTTKRAKMSIVVVVNGKGAAFFSLAVRLLVVHLFDFKFLCFGVGILS